VERKLTAILCADGSARAASLGEHEEATLRTHTSHRKLIDPSIQKHHGRLVNSAGDSLLVGFASTVGADYSSRVRDELPCYGSRVALN
jgi:adenylate cyclase